MVSGLWELKNGSLGVWSSVVVFSTHEAVWVICSQHPGIVLNDSLFSVLSYASLPLLVLFSLPKISFLIHSFI